MNSDVISLLQIVGIPVHDITVLVAGAVLVGYACAAIDAVLPQPTSAASTWVIAVRRVISWCGLNLGHARNAVLAGQAKEARSDAADGKA